MTYDLIVIGGGPAGYRAAERAGEAGLSVLCVEERALGGVCLNEGCIPTKTLLQSAKMFDHARGSEKYGVTAENVRLDHGKVLLRKNKVVKTLTLGVKSQLKNANVTVVSARGVLAGKSGEDFAVDCGTERYLGKRVLIATGSSPALPPIPGLAESLAAGTALTSTTALELTELPRSLAVIGGGVIGLELSSYFCSAGTQVTVVELLDHIAGENDRKLTAILQKNYEKKGMRFLLTARVTEVRENGVGYELNGQPGFLEAERVLVCIGRRANTAGLGLETVGVETVRGAIPTDGRMRTNVPGVYAAGDVNGKSMLAHTAHREAEVAVNDVLGVPDEMRYDDIPGVVYTNPELASVGETEETAEKKGLSARTVRLPMRVSGRYLAENEGGDGQMAMVVERGTGRILGAQALGNGASEFIAAAAVAITERMTANALTKAVFPHPTASEVLREAAFAADAPKE